MNKTAFITGASGDIGKAIAKRLAKDGFSLACCYSTDSKSADELGVELTAMNTDHKLYCLDVSDYENTHKIYNEAAEYFGGFDVLINCAGISSSKLFTDTSNEEFDKICAVNFKGIYNTCSAAVPGMIRKHSGKIINISSIWGVSGASCEVIYSATKAAVIGFTKALAKELAPSNIQVNCIAPGAIDTKMNNNLSPEEKSDFADLIPMGRFGHPDEIAGVVSFLAGDDSSYITAQVITADGGLL